MRFMLCLCLSLVVSVPVRADVTAVAWKVPAAQAVGYSPELVFAYSTDGEEPRHTFVTLEIKNAAGQVIAGDLIVIDSFAAPTDLSFGEYALPPGEYTAFVHCAYNSAAYPFTVEGMAPPPPPPGGPPVR